MLKKLLDALIKNSASKNSESPEKNNTDDNLSVEYTSADKIELNTPYPVYGMITSVIEEGDSIRVELNYNIIVELSLFDNDTGSVVEKKELLKERSFEPGIFMVEFSKIPTESYDSTKDKYPYEGVCTTVIFGKSSTQEVH